jgi:dipeptidyl aminopeptidase/acylaminoacyl peptidase
MDVDSWAPVERWIAYLGSEPRLKNVTAVGADHLAVTVEEPRGRALATALVIYRRTGAEWVAVRVLPGAGSAVAVGGHGLVYLCSAGGGQQVWFADLSAATEPTPVTGVPGRVAAMTWRADRRDLLIAVQSSAAAAASPFHPAEAAHTAEPGLSLASSRSGAAGWQLFALRLDGELTPLPCPLPHDRAMTGEIAWLAGGRVAAVIVRGLRNGRQRYGLAIWSDPAGEPDQVWLDGHDLTAPLSAPDGRTLAVLASTDPSPAEHLDHRPHLVDGRDLSVREIPTDPRFWDLPRCWLSDTTLALLSERYGTRVVVRHDLATGDTRTLPATESVLAVAPVGDGLAMITSTPASPPRLVVTEPGRPPVVVEASSDTPPPSTDLGWSIVHSDGVDTAYRLFLPDGTPRGLVAMFHGGPTMSWADWSWRWSPEPLCQLGFAVALLEPPMSSGYGPASQAAGWRRWRTGIADTSARLIDEVRATHRLDHSPLVVMGGSFGGHLALHVAGSRAVDLVATHAAPVDLAQVAYGCDAYWSWVREYGHPLDEADNYRAQSVDLTAIPTTTRVLLSHGRNDDLVPCAESVRSHRILRHRGVRSELALFRTEGHALRNPATAADWYRWVARACDELPDHRRGRLLAATTSQ